MGDTIYTESDADYLEMLNLVESILEFHPEFNLSYDDCFTEEEIGSFYWHYMPEYGDSGYITIHAEHAREDLRRVVLAQQVARRWCEKHGIYLSHRDTRV